MQGGATAEDFSAFLDSPQRPAQASSSSYPPVATDVDYGAVFASPARPKPKHKEPTEKEMLAFISSLPTPPPTPEPTKKRKSPGLRL